MVGKVRRGKPDLCRGAKHYRRRGHMGAVGNRGDSIWGEIQPCVSSRQSERAPCETL